MKVVSPRYRRWCRLTAQRATPPNWQCRSTVPVAAGAPLSPYSWWQAVILILVTAHTTDFITVAVLLQYSSTRVPYLPVCKESQHLTGCDALIPSRRHVRRGVRRAHRRGRASRCVRLVRRMANGAPPPLALALHATRAVRSASASAWQWQAAQLSIMYGTSAPWQQASSSRLHCTAAPHHTVLALHCTALYAWATGLSIRTVHVLHSDPWQGVRQHRRGNEGRGRVHPHFPG